MYKSFINKEMTNDDVWIQFNLIYSMLSYCSKQLLIFVFTK